MRSQLGLLFAAMVPVFLITNPGLSSALHLGPASSRLLRGLTLWVVFVAGRAYFAGVTLSRARLASRDPRARRTA